MTMFKKISILTVVGLFLASFPVIARPNFDYDEMIERIDQRIKESVNADSVLNMPVIVIPQVDNSYEMVYDDNRTVNILRILGLIIPFVFAMIVVFMCLWFKRDRFREKCRIIDKAIQNNYHLPETFFGGKTEPEFLTVREESNSRTKISLPSARRLQAGLIWIAFGLTGFIFFLIANTGEMAVLCLLPIFIGVAKIVTVMMIRNSNREDNTGI